MHTAAPILLTPGPLTTSARTRQAMMVDWGSWDERFNQLTASLCEQLLAIINGASSHHCVPLQGSGTFAVEAAIGTLVPRDGKVLVLINGAYGKRVAKICEVLGRRFLIYALPGHTLGHIAYYQAEEGWLFCGDTLFAAGCGRLFEGTPEQMHHSLQRLAALPDATAVYCTHEYTLSNLHFARAVEPHNPAVAARFAEVSAWRAAGRISLPSTIGLEKASNPFLRCHETSVKQMVDEWSGTATHTAGQVFAGLRRWKDQFRAG